MKTIFGHTDVDPVQTKYEMGNLQRQKLKAFGIEPRTSMASSSIAEREVCWSTWYHTVIQIKSFICFNKGRLQFLLSVIVCLRFQERAVSESTHRVHADSGPLQLMSRANGFGDGKKGVS